jgi:membrane dipeptidase
MIIFDAHLDLAWNALDWNRDLTIEVSQIRNAEQAKGLSGKGRGCNTVSFPALRQGRVAVFIATLLARALRPSAVPGFERYSSMEAAYAAAQGQTAYYKTLQRQGLIRWITDGPSLERHVNAWLSDDISSNEPLGFILSM